VSRLGAVCVISVALLCVGKSTASADEIALSLVNPEGRIDIPVSALEQVKARPTFAVRNSETGVVHEYPDPHVELCVSNEFKQRICALTKRIVGQVMAVVVDCETVTKPIVREPLCMRSCFEIGANDVSEANALAQRIRRGTNRACAPSS
jgi:preprotein translocase subunit SecD